MTREEIKKAMRDTKREIVIKNLHKLLSLVEGYPEYEDCISYAIERLEQESVLDKIRAEIEEYKSRQLSLAIGVADLEKGKRIALEYVLAILDKYESENKE